MIGALESACAVADRAAEWASECVSGKAGKFAYVNASAKVGRYESESVSVTGVRHGFANAKPAVKLATVIAILAEIETGRSNSRARRSKTVSKAEIRLGNSKRGIYERGGAPFRLQ